MNSERPHEIVNFSPAERLRVAHSRKWLPITDAEAQHLASLSEDQRAEWFAALPLPEKLRRYVAAEEEAGP